MSDLISAGWTQHHHPTPRETLERLRSISAANTKKTVTSGQRPVAKSVSSPTLNANAKAISESVPPVPIPFQRVLSPTYSDADGNMSTLLDPRSRTMSPANESGPASPSPHPDLSNEVATLSNKLISAINHQTNLDDTLSQTRCELEEARARIKKLEHENQEHAELLARGILIRKAVSDVEKSKVVAALTTERLKRAEVEMEKKGIEQELENLTTALFEEANKMVITARAAAQKEHDFVQRKNDQLKAQLADTESLLESHQDQLAKLKQVMEHMTEEREESTNPTAPSTPGLARFDSKDEASNEMDGTQSSSVPEPVSPSYPTSFTHLIHPVLRSDLSSYDDFISLLRTSKNIMGSRVSSGAYGTIGLGLGLGAYGGNASTTSISTSGTLGSSPVTPTTPASTVSSTSSNGPHTLPPLKETKFYKRSLAEDIEPTLRLDTAPGLSWLARRTVLNAICDGNLVIEPMPSSTKPFAFSCSLCGEARKDPSHVRSHRFRTSENENAQRYPLCRYCHGRVRSTCDFLGFLRIIKDGHWRAEHEEAEMAAWEESVRLREQMFWCRMGGGVVPTHQIHGEAASSPRTSGEARSEHERLTKEVEETGEIIPRDITQLAMSPRLKCLVVNRVSILSSRSDTAEGLWKAAQEDAVTPISLRKPSVSSNTETVQQVVRDSIQSTSSLVIDGEKDGAQRLSITIPSLQ